MFKSGLTTWGEGWRAISLVALHLFELGLEPNDARTQGSDLLVVDHSLFALLILELGDDFFEESLLPVSVDVLLFDALLEQSVFLRFELQLCLESLQGEEMVTADCLTA